MQNCVRIAQYISEEKRGIDKLVVLEYTFCRKQIKKGKYKWITKC